MSSAALPPVAETTGLAVDRTRLPFEPTMLASVRTATSLMTFGFTVYEFFQSRRAIAVISRR